MNPKLKRTSPQTTVAQANESYSDIQEQIQRRAYELYEQNGKEDGHDLPGWLQAELVVTTER